MARLVKIKCDDREIWMEIEKVAAETGPERVSVNESMEKAVVSFKKISDTIRVYCASLVKTFKDKEFDREFAPDRIRAEFGIKLTGEGNVYIVKSAAEASLRLIVEWEVKK